MLNLKAFLFLLPSLPLIQCGGSQTPESQVQIIGGSTQLTPENPASHSTVALALYHPELKKWTPFCSGTLIGSQTLVTANHCLKFELTSHLFNSTNIRVMFTNPKNQSQVELREVDSQSTFLNQEESTLYPLYDVGWVRFKGSLPFGHKPIEIWSGIHQIQPSEEIMLAGYGRFTEDIAVDEQVDGKKRFTKTIFNKYMNTNISQGLILTGPTPGKSSCHGDSGGSAFIFKNKKWYLLGLINGLSSQHHGSKFMCSDGYGVFTFVGAYKTWLSRSAQLDLPNAIPSEEVEVSFEDPRSFTDFASLCLAKDLPRSTLYTLKLIMDALESYDCSFASKNLDKVTILNDFREPDSASYAPQSLPRVEADLLSFLPNLQNLTVIKLDLKNKPLPSLPKLSNVYINELFNLPTDFSLEQSPEITYLDINRSGFLKKLDLSKNLKLEHLSLTSSSIQQISDLKGLESLPNLRTLYLNDGALKGVLNLPLLPSLESLAITRNEVTTIKSPVQPSIQAIFADNNFLSSLDFLGQFPKLLSLYATQNRLSGKTCPDLGKEGHCDISENPPYKTIRNATITVIHDTYLKPWNDQSKVLNPEYLLKLPKGTVLHASWLVPSSRQWDENHHEVSFRSPIKGFPYYTGFLYGPHVKWEVKK